MKNKKVWIGIALVLAFLFIWFQVRPSMIRSACTKDVLMSRKWATTKFEREQLGGDMNKINAIEREKSEFAYKECLHEKGISE
jgi:hypothetical protein